MITDTDIKKLKGVFATEGELLSEIKRVRAEMATKEQLNSAIDKLDAVYRELKDFRQEQEVHVYQHERIDSDLDENKKRLEKLEAS